MPQDGSSNYQYPPGTPGIPDQTIESEAYNTFLDDLVVNDLNWPRPVHRGGSGASTADQALVNLSAEKATQVVTNYDAHLFFPGSFRSSTATGQGAPVDGHAFAGVAYLNEPLVFPPTNQNLIIEARDQNDTKTPGRIYVREKKAGVWGAWSDAIDGAIKAYAAPLDALAYSGMQVNGSMEISQEWGSTNISANGWPIDAWRVIKAGTMVFTAGRSGAALTPGFQNHFYVQITTPQASLGAGDVMLAYQNIEGLRIVRLGWGLTGARPITIGFWSSHGIAGQYSVAVYNSPATHSYVTTYTQAVSAVAQYNVVTIPGPTVGTWNMDNQVGLTLVFPLAAGATTTAPSANTWLAGVYNAAPGQVNGVTVLQTFRIGGVIVLPGIYAPTAAQSPLMMRSADHELVLCQRYYERGLYGVRFPAAGASAILSAPLGWKATKRVVPTTAVSGTGTRANAAGFTVSTASLDGAVLQLVSTAAGDCYALNETIVADARL